MTAYTRSSSSLTTQKCLLYHKLAVEVSRSVGFLANATLAQYVGSIIIIMKDAGARMQDTSRSCMESPADAEASSHPASFSATLAAFPAYIHIGPLSQSYANPTLR